MWRNDPGHGASTTHALPKTLYRHWKIALPKQRPAWPASQTRLQFDASYEPVVAAGRMFVGSTVDDSVNAFRTTDGKRLWQFFTDGPVRFAPVATKTRVYAASDDGHLYCLNAETGKLIWKINGGPSRRLMIGNHRLISSWPARGGPVLADGTVYFAAGIWPSMGIFIHAVDATTGTIKWTNSEMGSLYVVHPHGAPSFGSVVPQGYLTVNGDDLIIPGGRSTPAVLNRRTGKLKFFRFDKRTGHYRVTSRGNQYFVGGTRYGIADGASFGSGSPDVLTENATITSTGGSIVAAELNGNVKRTTSRDRKGRTRTTAKFTTKPLWKLTPTDGSPTTAFLLAGNRVLTAGHGKIAAFQVPNGTSKDVKQAAQWTTTINGEVQTMLAADQRLFVVTDDGVIHCYGGGPPSAIHSLRYDRLPVSPVVVNRDSNEIITVTAAEQRTKNSLRERAYCVVFGIGAVEDLGVRLARDSNHQVIVFANDAKKVDRVRPLNTRLTGVESHVSTRVGDLSTTQLPPYLASLIVVDDVPSAGFDSSPSQLHKLFHALRPYGGVACLRLSKEQHAAFATAVAAAKLANPKVTRDGKWSLLRRVGALPTSAGWTHQYADASNSVVSRDELVKAPLGVLWFGGPPNDKILPRHGHGPSPQVAGGRLFIEGPDMIRAVDVYTGRLLWETELKDVGAYYNVTRHFAGAGEIGSNYVSQPDAVYVVYGTQILELDAATGKLKKEFALPKTPNGKRPMWGHIAVEGDYLVAASTPVSVGGAVSVSKKSQTIPSGFRSLIKPNDRWSYLAGSDPKPNWTGVDFAAAGWKTGQAGFGYGDNDDKTKLAMSGRYSRVYLRKTFDGKSLTKARGLALMINFDDGFIAYLNGKEIARVNVTGSGAKTKKVGSHEAKGFERFDIRKFRELLRPGKNVFAIEGHNSGLTSSDFSLDPYVIVNDAQATTAKSAAKNPAAKTDNIDGAFQPVPYSSASRRLVVFNRKTGKLLWKRDAQYNFRHNCIVIAAGKVFCIDGLSPSKIAALKRRGIKSVGRAQLFAIDIQTGRNVWTATKSVLGTFLNYSRKHDALLQAGSAYRDRAKDEVSRGMTVYRGATGKVVWSDPDLAYNGPCLLWRDKIITNGAGGFQLELLTGKKTGWTYSRMYGCNTAVGSEHLLTFRSGAAGFCDLSGDSGTGNIGGFRSSCTANLIAADGVLNAPDYTRTCSCAYQMQTSLALIHMPNNEFWTFNNRDLSSTGSERIGFNFGAPGDRRSADGTLWFDFPSVGGPSPKVKVEVAPKSVSWFRRHSSTISGDGLNWVGASGGEGISRVLIELKAADVGKTTLTVRLHFAERAGVKPGERVFSVAIQGKTVLNGLDVVKSAGGANRTFVREFKNFAAGNTLEITLLKSRFSQRHPLLCGVEIIRSAK